MERLSLAKPRATTLKLLPLSPALPIGVHWHHRSWVCAQEAGNCRLCDLVPRRAVVYFAAALRTSTQTTPAEIFLIERAATWYHEVCRQSGTNWIEALGRLAAIERVEGRSREVQQTMLFDDKQPFELVSIEKLAFSVAALYRCPQFPSCSSVGQTQRALSAFSARQQSLLLSQPTEVL